MNSSVRTHGADPGHPAHIVAPQIQQHEVLGQFLFVGQQISLMRAVLFGRGATGAGPGDGADRDLVIKDADQNFGAGTDHLKPAEIEIEHEGRRVGAPQTAVQRKGRLAERLGPALRRDDLKDITCADIFLRLFNNLVIAFSREIRHGRRIFMGLAQGAAGLGQGAVKVAHSIHHPLGRLGISRPRRQARIGPGRCHHGHIPLDPIQHRHDRGPQHQRIRQTQRIGIHIRQMLDQADHVIAQIAEQPRAGGRQVIGQVDPAGSDQRAQIVQRIAVLRLERLDIEPGLPVDAACLPMTLPDHIGFHPDDRIPSAHLAAGDRF